GLLGALNALRFNLVGYGCTTCIGNSGPLPEPIAARIEANDLAVAAVLSGNRNFEGRIHPQVKAAYLASPPLVVAFALAGRLDIDLTREPLGRDVEGKDVFLADLWPSNEEVGAAVRRAVARDMFTSQYARIFDGDAHWQQLPAPTGALFVWEDDSTYVREPPFFVDMPTEPAQLRDIENARVLALLGDSITTDHISPAGSIAGMSPAAGYLRERGLELQGVRCVIAQSYERIHRSNLVGMGILPLQFHDGESAETLRLDGHETFTVRGIAGAGPGATLRVSARRADGSEVAFDALCR